MNYRLDLRSNDKWETYGWYETRETAEWTGRSFIMLPKYQDFMVLEDQSHAQARSEKLRVGGSKWFPHHHELYPELGLKPGHPLPADGFEARQVQGWVFKCLPASGKGRRSPHRLLMLCPHCDFWLPFGRYVQHAKGKKHKENKLRGGG